MPTVFVVTSADCAHRELAVERAIAAIAAVPLGSLDVRPVTAGTAEAAGVPFAGSPTFALDDRDLFFTPSPAFEGACRVYVTEKGMQGAPTVEALANAISDAMFFGRH
ncbi:MAG: hypothetical protein ACXIUP_12460 [Microcella sp.]